MAAESGSASPLPSSPCSPAQILNGHHDPSLVVHLIRDVLFEARAKLTIPPLARQPGTANHQQQLTTTFDIYRQYPDFNAEYSTQQRLMLIFLNMASDASLPRTAQKKSRQLYEKCKNKVRRSKISQFVSDPCKTTV